MKLQKLLKKLALPIFALAVVGMLAACSSPSGGGSGSGSGSGGQNNTPGSTTPLVDESEVTVSASKIELSDGNWSYKEIGKANDGDQKIREAELTVSENGSVVVYTSMKKISKGTISAVLSDSDIDKEIADAQANGVILMISGNTYTSTEVYSDARLEKENKYAKYDFSSSSFKNIKTNSDKTKYSWTKEETLTSYNSQEDAEKEVNGVERTFTYNCYLVKKSSASNSDSTPAPANSDKTNSIDGTYEGTITGAGNSLYASVEISGKTYSVKMWTSSAKTGNPFQTSSGTISTTQKTVKGMMFGGTGTDHTFTAQPNGNNGWTVTIILFNGTSYSGIMTKGGSGSQGEFPFDNSNMYLIMDGNERLASVPADYVDDILKGLSASDYDKDDTNKTITLKSVAAAETVMSNYESVMIEAMPAEGYEPMED